VKAPGVNSVDLFVTLAEMDLASRSPESAATAVRGVMGMLESRGDVEKSIVDVEPGTVVIRWWPRFPAKMFKVQFSLASLNPAEAAVISVMGS